MRFFAFVLVSSAVFGQVDKSNLTGIVRDASGAAIPDATIRITNKDTGAARSEVSDATGFYRFT